MYAHEVTQERLQNGIPYHKEVLFWYKCFAQAMKDKLTDQESNINELIDIIDNEFPAYEISEMEQNNWQSGVFSGVLGQSSMSHGTLKDQSIGKWQAKDSKLTLIDGSVGRLLCINGLPHGDGTLFKLIWAAAALADEKYHDLIVQAHMDYILVGSQIITTNR